MIGPFRPSSSRAIRCSIFWIAMCESLYFVNYGGFRKTLVKSSLRRVQSTCACGEFCSQIPLYFPRIAGLFHFLSTTPNPTLSHTIKKHVQPTTLSTIPTRTTTLHHLLQPFLLATLHQTPRLADRRNGQRRSDPERGRVCGDGIDGNWIGKSGEGSSRGGEGRWWVLSTCEEKGKVRNLIIDLDAPLEKRQVDSWR